MLARHAARLLIREPGRSVTTMIGTTLAAGLVCAVLLFGVASSTTVTRRALAAVPVDQQIVLADGEQAGAAAATAKADPAVRAALPFDLVHIDTAERSASGSATQTSSGVILGLPPDYTTSTGWFGTVSGSIEPGQVAISRDLASNLGATAGDTITFHLAGGSTVDLKVSGVVDTAGADVVLGPLDAAHRAAGANPPANVAVMALGDIERLVLPQVPPGTTAADPAAASSGGSVLPAFAAEPAVRREVHVRLDHALVPGDPAAASTWLDAVRRRLDRQGAGAFQVVDDAAAALEPIASDLAWGQVLFLFLALPGVLVALGLERLAADATRDSTRRHIAWLRGRGAGPRALAIVLVGSATLASLAGAILGVVAGSAVAMLLYGTDLLASGADGQVAAIAIGSVVAMTLAGATMAALSLRRDIAREVRTSAQSLVRATRPAWERYGLDLLLLVVGVVALLVIPSVRPVVTAEGNATVSLALSAFVAPCILWIGLTLVVIRLAGIVTRLRVVRRGLGRSAGITGELAGASLAARSATVGPIVVVIALAMSFAVSTLVFQATYLQQQRVDARLTLGADLKATPTAGVGPSIVQQLAGPGVAQATPFVDRIVYVGPEAQDLLAIDPAGLPAVAPLADSFFSGITADAAMAALRSQPDGILVSAETARDYSIVPGDRVRIRVPDARGELRQVDFRMIGIALEFPTAPKDAFLVANLDWVRRQTGDDRISFVLASATGDASSAAQRLAARLGSGWTVDDLTTTNARIANEVTSVDLARLVLVDLLFALLIVGVGIALFLGAAFADRARELATLSAVGAEPRQVLTSLAIEAAAIVFGASLAGLVTGLAIGAVLVGVLSGIFDPPPTLPSVPVGTVALVCGLAVVGGAAALLAFARRLQRLDLVGPLRVR
jgi:putative ABC transport system permease protein